METFPTQAMSDWKILRSFFEDKLSHSSTFISYRDYECNTVSPISSDSTISKKPNNLTIAYKKPRKLAGNNYIGKFFWKWNSRKILAIYYTVSHRTKKNLFIDKHELITHHHWRYNSIFFMNTRFANPNLPTVNFACILNENRKEAIEGK